LILDKDICGPDKRLKTICQEALKGGVDMIQLRDKMSSTKDIIRRVNALLPICKKYDVPLIINDALDVAVATNADGLHLGQEDCPVRVARKMLGPKKIIGLSCHSNKDVMRAKQEKVDYLGFGPVYRTETKPHERPKGLRALKKALTFSKKPVFPIGGITMKKIQEIKGRGPVRIAVCREICEALNVRKMTEALKEKTKNV
jgi:thiamine-phosphate pyrophosphorylase